MNTTKLYNSAFVPNIERNVQFILISYLKSYSFEIQVFFPSSMVGNYLKRLYFLGLLVLFSCFTSELFFKAKSMLFLPKC